MKIDYNFIKQILQIMEEYDKYCISSHYLMKKLNVNSSEEKNKFIGHIFLLSDNNAISCDNDNYDFGYVTYLGGNYDIIDVNYRLTARGYEFLDILKNDTAFNRVKDFAFDTALDIGKQILVKLATGGM